MAAALAVRSGQVGGDAVEHSPYGDVDHAIPLVDPQIVER
jgi:hypothetical protein